MVLITPFTTQFNFKRNPIKKAHRSIKSRNFIHRRQTRSSHLKIKNNKTHKKVSPIIFIQTPTKPYLVGYIFFNASISRPQRESSACDGRRVLGAVYATSFHRVSGKCKSFGHLLGNRQRARTRFWRTCNHVETQLLLTQVDHTKVGGRYTFRRSGGFLLKVLLKVSTHHSRVGVLYALFSTLTRFFLRDQPLK